MRLITLDLFTPFQQQGLPQQQSPYMMMGGSQQQQPQQQHQPQSQQAGPQQSYASYMIQQQQQGGMKAGALPQSQQYYGNMPLGRQVVSQASLSGQPQHMANQMQTPPQDYSSFQQQQMQHRFPQVSVHVYYKWSIKPKASLWLFMKLLFSVASLIFQSLKLTSETF